MADDGEEDSPAGAAAVASTSSTRRSSQVSVPSSTQHFQGATPKQRPGAPPPGVIPLPPGSRGPRSLYLRRQDNGFGFTLRHFIVYPPEPPPATDGSAGPAPQPMDTIFVRRVAEGGAGALAGLRQGDRIVAVNGRSINCLTYPQVVGLIKRSPPYLHLLVVPQQDDVLQKYFSETAHNPETNRRPSLQEPSSSTPLANPSLAARVAMIPQTPSSPNTPMARTAAPYGAALQELNVQLQPAMLQANTDPGYYQPTENIYNVPHDGLFDLNSARSRTGGAFSNIYSEPYLHNLHQRPRAQPQTPTGRPGAQPQVPTSARPLLRRHSVRRSSEGSSISDSSKETRASYESGDYCSINSERLSANSGDNMLVNNGKQFRNAPAKTDLGAPALLYPNKPGCRLSLDAGRRESSGSLLSSAAEGSKDSLSSYGSSSTLTGQDTDDSVIMSRFRKSFEKKEEFLRRPSQPTGFVTPAEEARSAAASGANSNPNLIQREFYGRPQKLQKQIWPPTRQAAAAASMKPLHHDFERIKSDLDIEKEYNKDRRVADRSSLDLDQCYMSDSETQYHSDGLIISASPLQKSSSQREKGAFATTLSRIHENIPATVANFGADDSNGGPSSNSSEGQLSENTSPYPAVVWRRTRQFESGRSLPDDESGSLSDRTSLYRGELARLSSKRVVPNVAVRKREFETRTEELSRERRREQESLRRLVNRESRSLESGGKTELNGILRGNMIVPIGSKYLHCVPPSDYRQTVPDVVLDTGNPPVYFRARSNSAGSWAMSMQHADSAGGRGGRVRAALDWHATPNNSNTVEDDKQRHKAVRQDSYLAAVRGPSVKPTDHRKIPQETALDENEEYTLPASTNEQTVPICDQNTTNVPNDSSSLASKIRITLTGSPNKPAVRPTHLPISDPIGQRLLTPDDALHIDDMSPDSSGDVNMPAVVRRTNLSAIGDEERAMRRVSYLKATLGDRMLVDSDFELSDTDETTPPQVLRSNSTSGSGNLTSGANVDKENHCPIIKEGAMHCKVTLQDGKRATDRSWKQVWAVLRGPQLILYRSHHQSPMGLADLNADVVAPAVDVRYSFVDVAGDYTKRKNVLRVSSVAGAELLLQADGPADMLHWVRALQEQATNEPDDEVQSPSKQQAVPQQVPAGTSVQVQGSTRLSPLPGHKSIRKLTSFRNRSPTGQSPVNKTRKPSQVENLPSPKSKTWGRVVKQFRKIHHGTGSPSSPTAPEGATIGIPLELCPASTFCEFVPLLVEICTRIVEERGLDVIGIYRVPGNTAAITLLTEEVNKGFTVTNSTDPRWNDVNVVSSLLKSFFRRLPDSLITVDLYPKFIEADKIDNNNCRLTVIRKLLGDLPDHHYETLKYLMMHLKRIVEHSEVNKMEARNLAIVFGPTLVRAGDDNMVTMVTDMSHQCRIVESLLCHVDWFFSEEGHENFTLPPPSVMIDGNSVDTDSSASIANHSLLINNIDKIEGMKSSSSTGKEVAKVIKSTIISAAHRKMQRGNKSQQRNSPKPSSLEALKVEADKSLDSIDGELTEAPSPSVQPPGALSGESLAAISAERGAGAEGLSTTSTTTVKPYRPTISIANGTIRTYAGLSATTQERIRKFEQETRAMLARRCLEEDKRRQSEMDWSNNDTSKSNEALLDGSKHAGLDARLAADGHCEAKYANSGRLPKNNSASNVMNYKRYTGAKGDGSAAQMYADGAMEAALRYPEGASSPRYSDPRSRCSMSAVTPGIAGQPMPRIMRRGSSVENVNLQSLLDIKQPTMGAPSNGTLKRLKTGKEQNAILPRESIHGTPMQHRCGSLDSLDKVHTESRRISTDLSDDGSDLLTSLTTTFDRKLKSLLNSTAACPALTVDENIPYFDESPEKPPPPELTEPAPKHFSLAEPPFKLFRNPSLHKSKTVEKLPKPAGKQPPLLLSSKLQKEVVEREKDEDSKEESSASADNESMPDNDRIVQQLVDGTGKKGVSEVAVEEGGGVVKSASKLKRSESLNKTDTKSTPNGKLKRSESLNRASDKNEKLQRVDSLTKTEKTECNISKKRELGSSSASSGGGGGGGGGRRSFTTKLKRKNGMPERSIKRRHTVGGTKDFDKVHWLDNRLHNQTADCEQAEHVAQPDSGYRCCGKEKPLRTSSPDLTRRERFLLEVSLLGPEGMIVALRKHLVGSRPHSLPEARVYKVPLESHV